MDNQPWLSPPGFLGWVTEVGKEVLCLPLLSVFWLEVTNSVPLAFRVAHESGATESLWFIKNCRIFIVTWLENLTIQESVSRNWYMVFITSLPWGTIGKGHIVPRTSSVFSRVLGLLGIQGRKTQDLKVVLWGWVESSTQVGGGQGQADRLSNNI